MSLTLAQVPEYGALIGGVLVVSCSIAVLYLTACQKCGDLPIAALTLTVAAGGALYCKRQAVRAVCCPRDKRERNLLYIMDPQTIRYDGAHFEPPYVSPLEDTTRLFQEIHAADPTQRLDVVICSDGGNLARCIRAITLLKAHPAGYTAYCNYGYSAGGLIAICANEIVMDSRAFVGKIDPIDTGKEQIITGALKKESYDKLAAAAVLNTMRRFLKSALSGEVLTRVEETLIDAPLRHWATYGYEEIAALGLPVRRPTEQEAAAYFGYFNAF